MVISRIYYYPTYQLFLTAGLSLLGVVILIPLWIKILKSRNIGQIVRTDGPQEHLQKQGTPTMGGLLILVVVTFTFLLMSRVRGFTYSSILALLTALSCGLLGFFDDYCKVIKARSLGLKARTKLSWQLIISLAFGWIAVKYLHLSTSVALPLTGITLDLGWFYYIFLFLIISATTNSVNLTDGLDGLAAGTVTLVMMAYAGIAFRQDCLDLAIFCAAIGGACIGFLWYNSYPADIFMGDTGALGLGGAIAALAVLTKTELFLLLIGGIYVIETLSVIIQVVCYKRFKKRVFKMTPIHHHFEILGWSETKVMIRFWIVSGALAGLGFALYFIATMKGG